MRPIRAVAVILGAVMLLTILIVLTRCCMHRVPLVVAGPIDPDLDAVGPISIGMTRDELIGILGPPLRSRDPQGSPSTDYFAGIYANVGWDRDDRLQSVLFKLDEFERRYNARQLVILKLPNHKVVLSRNLNWSSAQHLWENKEYNPPNVHVSIGNHTILMGYPGGRSVTLGFSPVDDKLDAVLYFRSDNEKRDTSDG